MHISFTAGWQTHREERERGEQPSSTQDSKRSSAQQVAVLFASYWWAWLKWVLTEEKGQKWPSPQLCMEGNSCWKGQTQAPKTEPGPHSNVENLQHSLESWFVLHSAEGWSKESKTASDILATQVFQLPQRMTMYCKGNLSRRAQLWTEIYEVKRTAFPHSGCIPYHDPSPCSGDLCGLVDKQRFVEWNGQNLYLYEYTYLCIY